MRYLVINAGLHNPDDRFQSASLFVVAEVIELGDEMKIFHGVRATPDENWTTEHDSLVRRVMRLVGEARGVLGNCPHCEARPANPGPWHRETCLRYAREGDEL